MNKTVFKDVNGYIFSQPAEVRDLLEKFRETIIKAAPGAEEGISYNMPSYKYHGVLVYFAVFRNHIGFYPRVSGIEAFKKELSVYKGAKGSVQFPLDKPFPCDLIKKIVVFRVNENLNKKMKIQNSI